MAQEVRETRVVNVKKAELREQGYEDFADWASHSDHVYIGRNMDFYVKGTKASKWANPYNVKTYGRKQALEMYRNYIKNNPDLLKALPELRGKILGCWCAPEPCHGDILIELLSEKFSQI